MAQRPRTKSSNKDLKDNRKTNTDGSQHRRSLEERSAGSRSSSRFFDENTKRDIVGVLFFILAVVLLLIVCIPISDAVVSNVISEWMRLILGMGSYILPFILAAIGFTFIYRNQKERLSIRASLGLAIVFIALLGFIALFSPIEVLGVDSPFLLFSETTLKAYGGYIGAGIAWVGITFFGHLITGVILVGIMVVGCIIIGFSISNLTELVKRKTRERALKASNSSKKDSPREQELPRMKKRDNFIGDVYGHGRIQYNAPNAEAFDVESAASRTRPLVGLGRSNMAKKPNSEMRSFHTPQSFADDPWDKEDRPNPFGEVLPLGVFDASKIVPIMGLTKEERAQEEKDFAKLMEEFGGQTDDDFDEDRFFDDIKNGLDPVSGVPFEESDGFPYDDRDEFRQDFEDLGGGLPGGVQGDTLTKTIPLDEVMDAELVEPKVERPKILTRPVADIIPPQRDAKPSPRRISLDEIGDLESKISAITLGDSTPIEILAPDIGGPSSALSPYDVGDDRGRDAETGADCDSDRDPAFGEEAVSDDDAHDAFSATGSSGKPKAARRVTRSTASKRTDSDYKIPSFDYLKRSDTRARRTSERILQETAHHLADTLSDFGINAEVVGWIEGPTVTLFKVNLPSGVRVSRVTALNDDIALALAAPGVRIFAPIPGTNYVGIEVPNKKRQNVLLADVLKDAPDGALQIAIGKDVEGNSIVSDLSTMPHLLIGGTTGSGKSVSINAMIMSILMRATPDEVRFIMIDPKRVEFTPYNGIPHLYVPVVTEPREAASALSWGVAEMERRLKVFSKVGARNIAQYNAKVRNGSFEEEDGHKPLPYIVIIIDELADLMMNVGKEVEFSISRIAQLARAAGIHLIVATQRPSTNVVTGLIKANITNRIAFNVASGIDSRVILDTPGAENLIGLGDLLLSKPELSKPQRIQGCYVSEGEIESVVAHIKAQSSPEYHSEILSANVISHGDSDPSGGSGGSDDPLIWEAAELVCSSGIGSTSNIQRRLKVGYSRAGRIMDQLEEKGIVGPPNGSKPREVILDSTELETLKAFEMND